MKKLTICLLLSILFLCGCEKSASKSEVLEFPELTCLIDSNNNFHCDNEDSVYDNNGNLIVIASKRNNNFAHYYYIYNNEMIISMLYDNCKILFSYYDNGALKSIQYKNGTDTITYELFYNQDNKIEYILKSYSYSEFQDKITYEYYIEDGSNYVKEKTNKSGIVIERIFKEENMPTPRSVFEVLNFFPETYYQNLIYEPFYNLVNVNHSSMYEYAPIYVSKTETLKVTTFNGAMTTINYYYDKFGHYITDSNQNSVRNYKQEGNKLICETIEKVENDTVRNYYQYKIIYEYENGKLIKFNKYPKKEITYNEYKKQLDYYLTFIFNK